MTSSTELSLAFISRRPDAAAQVFSTMSVEDAAAFINSIPTRYAITLFLALSPGASALIINQVNEATATSIIRDMETGAASALLRQLSRSEQQTYLEDMPRGRRREFERSLSFAADSVGSKTTTDIPSLSASETVETGLRMMKENSWGSIDSIVVIDSKRSYVGIVHVLTLLRHPVSTRLVNLIDSSCPFVSPNTGLEQAGQLQAWQVYRQLPVVSGRGEPIGMIERKALAAVDNTAASKGPEIKESMAGLILGAMIDCSIGLVAMFGQSESGEVTAGESNGH